MPYSPEMLDILATADGVLELEKGNYGKFLLRSGESQYFINTTPIWSDPANASKAIAALKHAVKERKPDVLIGVDKMYSDAGVYPLVGPLSLETGVRSAIAKEYGHMRWQLYGWTPREKQIVMFIDSVTDTGELMSECLAALKERYIKDTPVYTVVVPLYDRGNTAKTKLHATGKGLGLPVVFEPLVRYDDLFPEGVDARIRRLVQSMKKKTG